MSPINAPVWLYTNLNGPIPNVLKKLFITPSVLRIFTHENNRMIMLTQNGIIIILIKIVF